MKSIIVRCIGLSLLLSACAWVNENPEGRRVNITTAGRVTHCNKVGNINVRSKYKLGFVLRNKNKLKQELEILARNEAVKLQASDIVADAPAEAGQQRYQAYRCAEVRDALSSNFYPFHKKSL